MPLDPAHNHLHIGLVTYVIMNLGALVQVKQ